MSVEAAEATPETLIVYVDGFNLYNGLQDAHKKKYLWLDLAKLARELRPRSQLLAVKYFTSPVEGKPETKQRQTHYQYALRSASQNKVKIIQGRHETREFECYGCRTKRDVLEEKETDVNIAINLVSDAYRKAADSFLVISGDTDLIPAMKLAQEVRPELFIAAAFPPQRESTMIKKLLPASFPLHENKLRISQLESTFTDGLTRRTYTRPPGWK